MEESLLAKLLITDVSDCAYSSITEALIAELHELGIAEIVTIAGMKAFHTGKKQLEEIEPELLMFLKDTYVSYIAVKVGKSR